jgi:transmembrane 9 superfamily protein 2/4
MVAMIMLRALNKDIAIYNAEDDDEPTDETGWKLVHGDVFRPPYASTLFCVSAGSGVQVFGMAIFAIIFASLGFLSPAYRGGLMTIMLVLFVLMGYVSSQKYSCLLFIVHLLVTLDSVYTRCLKERNGKQLPS